MNAANEARVRKIQKFGRVARGLCSAAIAFTALLAAPWGFFSILSPRAGQALDLDFGSVSFGGGPLDSIALELWILTIALANLVIFIWALWLIRAVFDHLARGEIYTAGPVHRLRALGRVMIMGPCLQILLAVATILLINTNTIHVPPTIQLTARITLGMLSGFAAAGVVMLLSWILDVGLGVREEADELRRDAELVV